MKMTPLPAVCHLLSKVFGCEGYRDMFEKKKERLVYNESDEKRSLFLDFHFVW